MRKIKGNINNVNGLDITFNLSLITFEEDNSVICYCPALDVYGYGLTEKEARSSMQTNLSIYFEYTTKKDTIVQDLRKLGWSIKNKVNKKLVPPTMTHMLETNRTFRRVFENYNYKKTATTVNIPAIA